MASGIFKKPLPYFALLLAFLFWGGNYVVAKLTLIEFPTMSLAFLRFTLAAIFLLPFVLIEKNKEKIKMDDLPKLLLAGVTMITFNIFFFYEGLRRTTAIDTSVLDLSVPIFSVLVGWIFLREKIFAINLFGILLGFIGAATILGLPLIFLGNFPTGNLLGNGLILLSDVSFVIGMTVTKKALKKYPSLMLTWIIFIIGALTFAIPAVNETIQNPVWISKVTVLGMLGLFYIVFLSSICAYMLFQWALKRIELEKATLFQYLGPAIAATFAVPFLGERISYSFIVGAVIVILGVYWGTLGKIEHHHIHFKHHKT